LKQTQMCALTHVHTHSKQINFVTKTNYINYVCMETHIIVPIFKSNDRSLVNNYNPVLLLSKVLEIQQYQ